MLSGFCPSENPSSGVSFFGVEFEHFGYHPIFMSQRQLIERQWQRWEVGGKFCVKVQLCIISITVKVKSITSDDVTQIDDEK